MKRFLLFLLVFSMLITSAALFSSCKGTPPAETTASTTLPVSTTLGSHDCTTTAPTTTEAPVTTKDPYGNDNNVSFDDLN